ncbi:hypothetical protein QBC35DRAFT_483126 [Podospora australis]|uniref:Pentatricopeptide repeat-containing protein n=1 Tax=Podospora australis TaxID=1536484 RepID=A0AAN6X7F2_9PEZI|nr:hypothetical protein QBC35DRAFT_483126 [Podospora australis]
MPPRTPSSLGLSKTGSYVCRSCIAANLRPVNPPLWATASRQASTVHRKVQQQPRTRPAGPGKQPPNAPPDPAELQRMLAEDLHNASEAPSSFDINYFSQDRPGELRPLKGQEEFGVESSGLDHDVEEDIDKLEKQMVATIKKLNRMEKQGKRDQADLLRRRFRTVLRVQYRGKTGPGAEQYGLMRINGFCGPRARLVDNLNIFLGRESVVSSGMPTHKDVLDCWKHYSAARKALATAWDKVPRNVWDFIWMVLSFEEVENPNRMQHIYVLSKDMQAAGVTLNDSQQLLAIEAMFIEGWQKEAIEAWKKGVVTIGSKPEHFQPYWELGVRMCAIHGDTERALRAADTLLRSPLAEPDPRILNNIIRALAVNTSTLDQAWETYRDMRDLLGRGMTIEDYDEVTGTFLSVGSVEYALQTFVDMMFSDAIDIRGKTRLPMVVGNHFFTGKWLKRLIGAGDLDGAYKAVVYLQAKSVIASAIQLNGLIGAWFRTGLADNYEKAEALAWSMIQARLDYVQLRKRDSGLTGKVHIYDPYEAAGKQRVASDFKCLTRATVETFSLLAENYCSRGLHSRLQELSAVMQEAEIGATNFIMNQLIRSYSQAGEAQEAQNLYRHMTEEQNIRPDAHTFLALFNTLSVNRLIQRDPDLARQDIETARQFFTEMVQANWVFDSPEILVQLPRTILFSLLKAKDYVGTIVASRTMRELFGFHPPDVLLVELISGIGSYQAKTKRNIERLTRGSQKIESLIMQHRKELIKKGHPGNEMTEEEKIDELHAVLEQIVLIKANAEDTAPEVVERYVQEAAKEMGLYDIIVRMDPVAISKHRKLGSM